MFSIAGINDNHLTAENGKLAILQMGTGRSDNTQSAPRVVIQPLVSHMWKALSPRHTSHNFDKSKRITQPSGAATPRDSDTHGRIAVPKALCVLQEHPRPRPKSGKVRRSVTRPGDVCERAERSEDSDSGPVRKASVSACKPLCAILLAKASVYPLSLVKANVGRFADDCDKSFFAVWCPLMEVGDGCL